MTVVFVVEAAAVFVIVAREKLQEKFFLHGVMTMAYSVAR